VKHVFHIFGKEFHVPRFAQLGRVVQSFSLTEKIIFGIVAIVSVLSALTLLLSVNAHFLVEVPRSGGTHHEGSIGTPRAVNPLLAISETDRDLTSLVYSGLMRITPDGELIPDLARDYTISDDGIEYTFTIRDDATFHDGERITADDIVFTVKHAQDPVIKSPRRADWEGVVVEKIDEMTVQFVLPQPYAPFLFNTTLGVLPEHIWKNVSAEEFPFTPRNIEPIGSGPYQIDSVRRNSGGITERFTLEAFSNFTLGKPYISTLIFSFYDNEEALIDALTAGDIDAINSISPVAAAELAADDYRVERFPLPRIFGVFFNQSQAPILASSAVRQALGIAVDRDQIIDEVLAGYGEPAFGPIPPSLIPFATISGADETPDVPANPTEEALAILTDAGFAPNESGFMQRETDEGIDILAFTISTADVPELVAAAERVVAAWRAIGADVTLKVFDRNDFTQNVIRPRQYDAIFFGEVIGRDLDFYAFWHSSQRQDPGLNIADYANIDVDAVLEDARTLPDSPERVEKLRTFVSEIDSDAPAAFVYAPDFLYIVPDNLNGVVPEYIATPSDRFLSVYNWYLETDTVWSIFR